jgi:hypothetical protein
VTLVACKNKHKEIDEKVGLTTAELMMTALHENITYNYNEWELYDSLMVNDMANIEIVPILQKGTLHYTVISNQDKFAYQIPTKLEPEVLKLLDYLKDQKDKVKMLKIIQRLE